MPKSPHGPPDWLKLCRLHQENQSRLRDDVANLKDALKAAKLRVDRAQADLEQLVHDSKDGQLFGVVGVIVTDPATGRPTDYKSINEQLDRKAEALPEQEDE